MTDISPSSDAGVTAVPVTPAPAQAAQPVVAAAPAVIEGNTPATMSTSAIAEGGPEGSTPQPGAEGHIGGGDAPAASQPAEAEGGIAGNDAAAEQPADAVAEGNTSVEGEAAAEPTPPEPIKYTDWELPENVELAADKASALGNIFGKYGLSQEATQEIVTYGSALIKSAQEQMAQAQYDTFNKSRALQRQEFEKQAGNRRETVLNDAKAGLALAMPNAKARAALLEVLGSTGAGDNTHVIHAFATIGKQARERSAPGPSISIPKPASAAERRYGPSK